MRIVKIREGAGEFFGFQEEKLLEMSFLDLLHENSKATFYEKFGQNLFKTKVKTEKRLRLLLKSGDEKSSDPKPVDAVFWLGLVKIFLSNNEAILDEEGYLQSPSIPYIVESVGVYLRPSKN